MTDFREQRWQEVEFTTIYRDVFVRYLQQGMQERGARQRAVAEVRRYLGKGSLSASGVRMLSATSGQSGQGVNGHDGQNGYKANGSVKQGVRAYLDEHPDLGQLSINQVLLALRDAGVQAGRTTVAEVIQERKHSA